LTGDLIGLTGEFMVISWDFSWDLMMTKMVKFMGFKARNMVI